MTLRLTYKWKSNKWCVFCSVCGLCSVREVLGFCGVLARLTGATANRSQPPAHPTSAPPCLLSCLPDRLTFFRLRADLKNGSDPWTRTCSLGNPQVMSQPLPACVCLFRLSVYFWLISQWNTSVAYTCVFSVYLYTMLRPGSVDCR